MDPAKKHKTCGLFKDKGPNIRIVIFQNQVSLYDETEFFLNAIKNKSIQLESPQTVLNAVNKR